ncbi:PREDICTED: mpv17-like protein [Bactrocera latifrons]|uniref:Mpv17-like protein n=1 Tax=Bactrocera latifrons TaxID=174628 RepID=A0A0K8WL19_BACLA|nr:PREDICTED: mpv17-like protein [Bactrocera latifrons]
MSSFVNAVRGVFRRHPFLANSAIYGSLYVAAEYSQQYLVKRVLPETEAEKEDIDYATIGRYAVMGTTVFAPTLYTWYKWLDGTFPGTTKQIIVKKLVLDQFLLTPYLLTAFYTGMSLMEQAEDPFKELREKFLPTFTRSCIFWLPAQTLNFVMVAPRFRVIYMGVCGFIWVNILCWIKRQPNELESASEEKLKVASQ